MKYSMHLFICMIMSLTCNSMEQQLSPNKSFKELTILTSPRRAQYLATNDRVIVSDEEGVRIINPITNEIVKDLSPKTISKCPFSIHPTNKKIAVWHHDTVEIYDGKTFIKEWFQHEKESGHDFFFSPIEPTLWIHSSYCTPSKSMSIQHNYTTNQRTPVMHGHLFSNIALHPTQNKVFVCTKEDKTFVYDLDHPQDPEKKEGSFETLANHYEYSHDGSFILAYDEKTIKIIDSDLKKQWSCCNSYEEFPSDNILLFDKAILNSDSSMIIAISNHPCEQYHVISYWDGATPKYLKAVKIEIPYNKIGTDITLSPDERKVIVTADNKCVIVPVPLETNKLIFSLYILKHCQYDELVIPDDIVYNIVNMMRAMHNKRFI